LDEAEYLLSVRAKLLVRAVLGVLTTSFVPLLFLAGVGVFGYAAAFKSAANFDVPERVFRFAPFLLSAAAAIFSSPGALIVLREERDIREFRLLSTLPVSSKRITAYYSGLGLIRAAAASVFAGLAGLPFCLKAPPSFLAPFLVAWAAFALALPVFLFLLIRVAGGLLGLPGGAFPVIRESRRSVSAKSGRKSAGEGNVLGREFALTVRGKEGGNSGWFISILALLVFAGALWQLKSGGLDAESAEKALPLLALAVSCGGGVFAFRRVTGINLALYRTLPVRFSRLLLSDFARFYAYAWPIPAALAILSALFFPTALISSMILPPAVFVIYWLVAMRFRDIRFAAGIVAALWTAAVAVPVLAFPAGSIIAVVPVLISLPGARKAFYSYHLEGK
jgi:hypothetical protein